MGDPSIRFVTVFVCAVGGAALLSVSAQGQLWESRSACEGPIPGVCAGVDLTGGRYTDLPQDIVSGDFRLTPPVVRRLTAQPGSEGRALIRATFARDRRLTPSLSLSSKDASITFYDDGTRGDDRAGDGTYAATLPLPFEQLAAGQTKMVNALLARRITDVPVYESRYEVGRAYLKDFGAITNGVLAMLPPDFFARLINPGRSLLITDPGVIDDPARTFDPCSGAGTGTPNGVWTFAHLMTEIANQPVTGLDPETMARDWFTDWGSVAFQGGVASQIWRSTTDLAHAPFKLVAIVNRVDLATNLSGFGGPSSGSGGEGRFIFQVCGGGPRMVIIEYGVPADTCTAIRDWASSWVALGNMTPGTAAYNAALETLTETFVARNAAPAKPNGSALNQIRTNAFIERMVLSGTERVRWLLHEFQIQAANAGPTIATVAQTPLPSFNGTADLANWINLKQGAILGGIHVVERFFTPFNPTRAFRGNFAETLITTNAGVTTSSHWHAPGIASNDARAAFSLATCDGCHTGETATDFRHLGRGIPLSGFLTGIDVPDPESPSTIRRFNDLARRAAVLAQIASGFCLPTVPDALLEVQPFDLGLMKLGPVLPPLPPMTYVPTIAAH